MEIVKDIKEALSKIKELIPKGSQVMNGSSITLQEIGFIEYLKNGGHGWKNLQEEILAEKDRAKQGDLRRMALLSDYFLSSANAVSQDGHIVAYDGSGSRTGAFLFAAKKLVIVAGVNKIVPTFFDAIKRIEEYALPLEIERMQAVYGIGSGMNKLAAISRDAPERTTLIIVKEQLGY